MKPKIGHFNTGMTRLHPYKGQKTPKSLLYMLLIYFLFSHFPRLGFAQDGKKIFEQDCATCHRIGQKLIGPDLAGVTEKRSEDWLKKFIKSSQQMVKSGDPEAVAIFEEFNQIPMPDNPHLDDAALDALLSYIAGASGTASMDQSDDRGVPVKIEAPEYSRNDVLMGKALFTGQDRFSNGGQSCISCHHANHEEVFGGGLLARDLTHAFERVGDGGIKSITLSPPFPLMAEAYRKRPITEKEAEFLAAFLHSVYLEADIQKAQKGDKVFFQYGLIGFLVILLLVGVIWKNRKSLSVNNEIFERQLKSV
jgi:cytochrome c551/c552